VAAPSVNFPPGINRRRLIIAQCWLYIYENKAQSSIYIGIADTLTRVYQGHNEAAEKLRDSPGSTILQTLEPFSSRADARKAEAIAIHVATISGTAVSGEDDDGTPFTYTNISGVHSTAELGPAIFTKEGTTDWSSLTGTVIVPIGPDQMDGRPAPFGSHGGAIFANRAANRWKIGRAKRPYIRRLIAVLTGSRNVILGDWDVDPAGDWEFDVDYLPWVVVPVINPDMDDPRDIKGTRLVGHRLNASRTYSPDLTCPALPCPALPFLRGGRRSLWPTYSRERRISATKAWKSLSAMPWGSRPPRPTKSRKSITL
jgi:predicted GIY-YIG superfamily endonuclease